MVNAEREIFIKKCLRDLDEDLDTLPCVQTDLLDYVETVYGADLDRLDISPETVLTRFNSRR
jgi:hypothetical protein